MPYRQGFTSGLFSGSGFSLLFKLWKTFDPLLKYLWGCCSLMKTILRPRALFWRRNVLKASLSFLRLFSSMYEHSDPTSLLWLTFCVVIYNVVWSTHWNVGIEVIPRPCLSETRSCELHTARTLHISHSVSDIWMSLTAYICAQDTTTPVHTVLAKLPAYLITCLTARASLTACGNFFF